MREKLEKTVAATENFASDFHALKGYSPLPWQRELYQRFIAGDFSRPITLPTGLGKTSILHIWLLALAAAPAFVPRRLVYVVNRRTIVDQATREAEKIRELLSVPGSKPEHSTALKAIAETIRAMSATRDASPLAISTLRGEFADNGEWLVDPARPAIIVGTVDMIGSRLLFSAYGRGFKSRPMHAGFLGQDSLIVHDEAHLEPAFQELLDSIRDQQVARGDFRRLQLIPLTATPRGKQIPFELTPADYENDLVKRRLTARKQIRLHEIDDEKMMPDKLVELVLSYQGSGRAILVFLRKLEDVKRVTERLPGHATLRLTGTLRGLERDRLVRTPIFQRFVPPESRDPDVTPAADTAYLVCTSAGEVGIDISADHLVCDLTPFESMAQRLGRVNRYGLEQSDVHVVYSSKFDSESTYDARRELTLALLRRLKGDGSPKALGELSAADRQDAFSPAPQTLVASDILFDTWALTTIRGHFPGRPPVADWLHGIESWQPPDANVAWRNEVELLTSRLRETYPPEDLLDEYPIKPHELLRDRARRVLDEIKKLAKRHPEADVWLINADDDVRVVTLNELAEDDDDVLDDKTIVLPPSVGGLRDGFLDATSQSADDVADEIIDSDSDQTRRRLRALADDSAPAPPRMMRLIRTLDLRPDCEDDYESGDVLPANARYWHWYVRPRAADDDGSRFSSEPLELDPHLSAAERHARDIVAALRLPEREAAAVALAARWHDVGKKRLCWQRSVGNTDFLRCPPTILAKSGGRMRPIELGGYRHEFGSLLDLQDHRQNPVFANLPTETVDLVLHLIAAHHGRARPHFPASEAFDPEHPEAKASEVASEVSARFVRLQKRYGRWGLAYLESLVRAADALASGAGT